MFGSDCAEPVKQKTETQAISNFVLNLIYDSPF